MSAEGSRKQHLIPEMLLMDVWLHEIQHQPLWSQEKQTLIDFVKCK